MPDESDKNPEDQFRDMLRGLRRGEGRDRDGRAHDTHTTTRMYLAPASAGVANVLAPNSW